MNEEAAAHMVGREVGQNRKVQTSAFHFDMCYHSTLNSHKPNFDGNT